MSPQLPEVRRAIGPKLVGRVINLQAVGDDEFEVLGRIVEIKLEDNNLIIKTEDTRRRWWGETEFKPFDQNEFSESLEFVQDAKIQADGTILLIPWGGYDCVYIRP